MTGRFALVVARVLIWVVVGVWFGAPDALAQQRVALVFGNGEYQKVPALPNPGNDAGDIAASLGRLGFKVRKLTDANFDDMRRSLIEFGRDARGAEMAIIYYAGHGMEIGGENWLIPTDAELRSDTDAENEAISLRAITAQVSNASQFGLVILDACRNNPFAAKMTRSLRTRAVAQGLTRTEPTDNVLIAYAAKDGTTANDGNGRNSPFTKALLNNLETPGLEVTFMFRNVRDEVMQSTKREQQPFVYGSLSKQAIYLKNAPTEANAPSATATPMLATPVPAEALPARAALGAPPSAPVGELKQADGLFTTQDAQRVRAAASRNHIPLPAFQLQRPDSIVPPHMRKFVGVWASKVAFGGGRGKQVVIIVTDVDADGRATGYVGMGPPTPTSFDKSPANTRTFAGRIEREALQFPYGAATWTAKLIAGDRLQVVSQRRDGSASSVNLETVWRLAERERSANRQVPAPR